MSKNMYVGINGIAHRVKQPYIGVSGVAKKVSKGYIGVSGVARKFYESKQPIYAMLYTSGNMVFQKGNTLASGETLGYSYTDDTDFENTNYFYNDFSSVNTNIPWYSQLNNINNVKFDTPLSPNSIAYWFCFASNLKTINYTNLNINSITNMCNAFWNCSSLTGSPICGPNVVDFTYAYYYGFNLTGSPVCGNKVTNMFGTYMRCYNLTGNPVCGPNVTNMRSAYSGCNNLTGSPVCGNKVTFLGWAYSDCSNLTGSAVCGPNVTNMYYAYSGCNNITTAVCGPNVTDMYRAYSGCNNITTPVCGNKVTNMSMAYYACNNITTIVCGPNVTDMGSTYYSCNSIKAGTYYIYSRNIINAKSCFGRKNNSRRFNIHVPANSTTLNTFLINNTNSIIGSSIKWNGSSSSYYYNTKYNIYIYPNTSM